MLHIERVATLGEVEAEHRVGCAQVPILERLVPAACKAKQPAAEKQEGKLGATLLQALWVVEVG
jgi:hypothetical protein